MAKCNKFLQELEEEMAEDEMRERNCAAKRAQAQIQRRTKG